MGARVSGGFCSKLAVAGAFLASMLVGLPAFAGIGGSVVPSFPTPIKVGDNKTAVIVITNSSTDSDST